MKRKMSIIGIAASLMIIGILAFLSFGRVLLRDIVKADLIVEDRQETLSYADCEWVVKLLDGKWYGGGNLSCGTSDAYLILTRKSGITATFYATFDNCPYVYYTEQGQFIRLSQEENDAFRALLERER